MLPTTHVTYHGSSSHPLRGNVTAQACALAAAAIDGCSLAVEVAASAAGLASCGPTAPPRTAAPPYTQNSINRRLTVPTYCLAVGAKARTRRRVGGGGGAGDDELGGDGGGGGWGGGGDDWWRGGGDPFGDDGGDAARPQASDALLAWSLFCALAFASTCQHLASPARPAPGAAALAATGLAACGGGGGGGAYTLIKSQLAAAFA